MHKQSLIKTVTDRYGGRPIYASN